jgi:deoxyxylulose-5-phosphate synthase
MKKINSSYFFGYPDEFIKQGDTAQIEKRYKLDKFSIANQIEKCLKKVKPKKLQKKEKEKKNNIN